LRRTVHEETPVDLNDTGLLDTLFADYDMPVEHPRNAPTHLITIPSPPDILCLVSKTTYIETSLDSPAESEILSDINSVCELPCSTIKEKTIASSNMTSEHMNRPITYTLDTMGIKPQQNYYEAMPSRGLSGENGSLDKLIFLKQIADLDRLRPPEFVKSLLPNVDLEHEMEHANE
jgi:hypothetical protein